MKSIITCLSLILFFDFQTIPATAQVANLYPVTIGDRAFGMGGAFTALANDATAGWYNPAGLGFLNRTYINAVGNVYSYERSRVDNFVVIAPTSGTGGSANLDEKQVHATPSAFSVAKHIGKRGTLGFGIYVPRDINVEDSLAVGSNYDGLLGPTHEDFYERDSYSERNLYMGPSYGIKLNDNISIGTSIFILYSATDLDSLMNISLTGSGLTGSTSDIIKEKVTYWGGRLLLGTKAEFGNLNFGLTVFTPTLRFSEKTDSSSITSGIIGGATPASSVSSRDTSDTGRGWDIAAGVGWEEKGVWAAEVDVTYYVPEFTHDIAACNVPNARIGAEYNFTPNYLVRGGFFTDFSPWRATFNASDRTYDIDIYGFTVQLENRAHIKNTDIMRSFSIGLRYAFGNGSALGTLSDPTTSTGSSTKRDLDYESFAIMLGGTLSY